MIPSPSTPPRSLFVYIHVRFINLAKTEDTATSLDSTTPVVEIDHDDTPF